MKKILTTVLLLSSFVVMSIVLQDSVYAQMPTPPDGAVNMGNCYVQLGQCGAINANCDGQEGYVLWRDQCTWIAHNGGTCSDGNWYCVPQENAGLSDCVRSGMSGNCGPNLEFECSGEQVRNPDYVNFCQSQSGDDCQDAEYSGAKCIDPLGYNCLRPWTGYTCAPCTSSPCHFTTLDSCENAETGCNSDFEFDEDTPNPLEHPACSDTEIYTAIGCISIENQDLFITFFLTWALGLAGGIALILVVYSGILILTSGGDPKKTQAGKELLTAAITGFVFLLLSVYLLEFIGVDILKISGF